MVVRVVVRVVMVEEKEAIGTVPGRKPRRTSFHYNSKSVSQSPDNECVVICVCVSVCVLFLFFVLLREE